MSDDIRRIVSNWPEYGGHVSMLRAKERHPHKYPIESYVLNPDRAIFPVDLLYKVGKARYDRTLARTIDDGHYRDKSIRIRGLGWFTAITVMCWRRRLRIRSGGRVSVTKIKRRMCATATSTTLSVGCTNRSVKRDLFEADFGRLLELLWVNPEQIEALTLLNLRALGGQQAMQSKETLEAEKRTAIAKCTRRIDAARHLFEDGDISREEYVRRKEQNEREVAHWHSRTTETDHVALELTLCQETIARVGQMWNSSNDDDKQGLVRSLFEEIVLNLDMQRITSFKLKPWADNLISLRAALYQDEGQSGGNKTELEGHQGLGTAVTPTGVGAQDSI